MSPERNSISGVSDRWLPTVGQLFQRGLGGRELRRVDALVRGFCGFNETAD
jgi:hypothetical protein